MNLFYVPEINGDSVLLPEEEARHCIGVLRFQEGQPLTLIDGTGFFYDAIILSVNKKQVLAKILNKRYDENLRSYKLHIAIAPTKNIARFEWFLEKATEIGIDEVTPLVTKNSERKDVRTDRLEKILISAMKQSLKSRFPKLNKSMAFTEFMILDHSSYQLLMASCAAESNALLKDIYTAGNNVLILVGPEGDFASSEVEQALLAGFKLVSLGASRLRTETAGVVACHSVYLLNQP